MCTLMTLVTSFKLAQHCSVVWLAVTILTFGNNSMFVGMAENTLEAGVLACTAFKRCAYILMAGAAVEVFDIITILKCQRLVDLVAGYAVGKLLLFEMRTVAVQAVGNIAVLVVTVRTVNLCMCTRDGINDLNYT